VSSNNCLHDHSTHDHSRVHGNGHDREEDRRPAATLKSCSRRLHALRDQWKAERSSLAKLLAIMDAEASGTVDEVRGHFKRLHAALAAREEQLTSSTIHRQKARCASLLARVSVIDSFCAESKRLIRLEQQLPRGSEADAALHRATHAELERQRAYKADGSGGGGGGEVTALTAAAKAQKLQFRAPSSVREIDATADLTGCIEGYGTVDGRCPPTLSVLPLPIVAANPPKCPPALLANGED
jgi:hypothetical protein